MEAHFSVFRVTFRMLTACLTLGTLLVNHDFLVVVCVLSETGFRLAVLTGLELTV